MIILYQKRNRKTKFYLHFSKINNNYNKNKEDHVQLMFMKNLINIITNENKITKAYKKYI